MLAYAFILTEELTSWKGNKMQLLHYRLRSLQDKNLIFTEYQKGNLIHDFTFLFLNTSVISKALFKAV